MVTQTDLDNSLSYEEYFNLVEKYAKGGGTTGEDQSNLL